MNSISNPKTKNKIFSPTTKIIIPYYEENLRQYSYILKGSNPIEDLDNDNDDLWFGVDDKFSTPEEALNELLDEKDLIESFGIVYAPNGEILYVVHPIKITKPNDDDWKREIATEAGMCLGIDAYNDHMGY